MDHRQGGAGRALGPDPGNGRHDEGGNRLVTLTGSFLEEARERLLGGLVDRLVLGQQREEGALDEPDGIGAEMGFKLSRGDVEPGGNRPARRQDLVIGGNVDQVVLDAGAEGVQRVLAVGPERCGGQDDAGAAGVGDAGENPGELVGRRLVALVDEDHPSPLPKRSRERRNSSSSSLLTRDMFVAGITSASSEFRTIGCSPMISFLAT